MTHPSSLDLEAFATGDASPMVASHLGACTQCAAFVDRLKGALSTGPSRSDIAARIARAAANASPPPTAPRPSPRGADRAVAQRSRFFKVAPAAATLAAAAVFLLVMRRDRAWVTNAPVSTSQTSETPHVATETTTSDTTFKGAVQTAVIRERGGEQSRFTGEVTVRTGDRLRLEVALDREQLIVAAVVGDDGSWVELMVEGVRSSGTHFSEHSVRVDSSPTRGTILVGAPDAVKQARQTKRFENLVAIRVEWDGR